MLIICYNDNNNNNHCLDHSVRMLADGDEVLRRVRLEQVAYLLVVLYIYVYMYIYIYISIHTHICICIHIHYSIITYYITSRNYVSS